jgi:prefoldin alpha subunit
MENEQELALRLSMFEQQIKQTHQQLQAVEQAIVDIISIDQGLDELVGSKDKEVLASIGRGIFVKTKLISEELIVDIGDKNFVAKDIASTKKIIQEQVEKLEKARTQLEEILDKINDELTKTYLEYQGKNQ